MSCGEVILSHKVVSLSQSHQVLRGAPVQRQAFRSDLARRKESCCPLLQRRRRGTLRRRPFGNRSPPANIVGAIKTSGRFSEAMNQALGDLETQRESVQQTLGAAKTRADKRIGAATLAEKILDYFGDFDRMWKEGLTIEERKELLRCYVHQVNIDHSPTRIHLALQDPDSQNANDPNSKWHRATHH